MVGYIVGVVGLAGVVFGLHYALKLREWERHLMRTRIAIAYKGRVKMDPHLFELLQWALLLDKDERARGRAIFKMGNVTVAILKGLPKQHGKTETKVVQETEKVTQLGKWKEAK